MCAQKRLFHLNKLFNWSWSRRITAATPLDPTRTANTKIQQDTCAMLLVSPVIWKWHRLFSKRGRISFGSMQAYNHIRDPLSLRLRHIWFNFESIFCLRRNAKNCVRKFRLTSAAFFFVAGKNQEHEIILISFFPFRIRVKWDLYGPLWNPCVCGERDEARAIERAIIIYSTNWIVKFKFIRNSSFPRGSHRKRGLSGLAPLARFTCALLFSPNWTQRTWNGLVTVWKRKVSR